MIDWLAGRLAPRALWRYRARAWHSSSEPELALLPQLTDRQKLSIDVGAAEGSYTAALVPLSSRVVAFEPNPEAAQRLRKTFRQTSLVSVEEVALSSEAGVADMRIPADRFWRSTIELHNPLKFSREVGHVAVTKKPLDTFDYRGVGFIKIDVEGHELDVLKGADATISRERPCLLIEVEEQHHSGAVNAVFAYFLERRYRGAFYLDGAVKPIAEFDHVQHQDIAHLDERGAATGIYVNNFFFVPAERAFDVHGLAPARRR
jgi:FkbM family methyltransferase